MTVGVARDQVSAGGLALLVHLLFFLALVFGVSWKTLPEVPVYADLWRALPARPELPSPLPEPPTPDPVKPLPPPKPVGPAPPVPPAKAIDPDIALKEKKAREAERLREEKRRAEETRQRLEQEKEVVRKREAEAMQLRAEEERKRQEADKRRRLEEEMIRLERERLAQEEKQLQIRREEERKAAEARRLAQEKARKDMEAMLSAELADDLAAEARGLRQQAAVGARLKLVDDYKGRIQLKIKGVLINPPGLQGKPEAVYRVELLPNGEVVRVMLVKHSGQTAYDRAVESAILKASPLPLPPDRDAAAAFRDGLELKFRPD